MIKKTKSIKPAEAFTLYLLWSFLSLSCFTIYSMPCHAASNKYYAKSETNTYYDSNPKNDLYCQPAEIEVNDRIVRAGLLYDISAETIIWEKRKDQAYPIASLTKMMVAFLAMEDIFSGKVSMNTLVKVTPQASRMKGSKVHLRAGCHVSVKELLKATLISSGNDASYLLAQFLGGTESAFVKRMNRRAAQLGMKNTFYSNSTGMPARKSINDNRSSPSDLLILAREMLKYDQLLEIAGTSNDKITQDNKIIKLRNHNGLVATYSYVDGLKTGFTRRAKYCLVATAKKNDRRLIAIALGVSNWKTRNQFVANMISRYYKTLGLGKLESKKAYASKYNAGEDEFHRVKRGETLYKISNKYDCSVIELKSWNHLRNNIIIPGQKLFIYRNLHADSQTGSSPNIYFYKVRPGDTLWNISQKYEGISVNDIMKINHIKRARDLKSGTILKIIENV
jgi:D-alanyl-D-alanine carboxypeptidase